MNFRRDLVIWLVHLIYTVRLALRCAIIMYVILNYCIRFAVLPCVRLFLNYCYYAHLSRTALCHHGDVSDL